MINYDTLLDNLKDLDLFNNDVSYGTERLMYGPFYKKYFNFRNAHISNKFIPIPNDIQLPAGSCVHILNNLYNEERGLLTSDLPDLSYPFIKNENYRKFIYHVKEPNVQNPNSIIQFPDIRYIYRSINLDLTLRKFRTENENTYRQLQSLAQIPQTPTTLTIINHNPLFRVRVRELLPQYKRFLVIFGSILNIAATIEKKVQYIFIPLGNRVYLKNMFAMAEKEIKPTSIKAKNDFHYFVMMHWLNFLNPFSDQSIILKYPKEKWSTTVFVFYYGDYYMFWTLEDIVNLNQKNLAYNRIINQYNSLVITGMGGEIPDTVTEEEIHETVQELKEENTPIQIEGTPDKQEIEKKKEEEQREKENKEKEALNISRIISSIADKTKSIINIKEDDISLPPLQYKGVKKLSKAQKNIVPDIDDVDLDDELTPEEISSHIDDYAPIESVDDTSSIENTFIGNSISNKYISGDLSHITPITDKKSISQLGISYMKDIDNSALALIEQQEKLTLKQKERLLRVAQAYKNLTIGDETLESIISEEKDVNVSENKVDNLDNYLVDKSMENSSIQTFDTDYMQKLYKKHIAEVATSFTKNGMFLVGVEENFSTDELNRLVKYKFTYEDIKGKRHTVKFTLPFVGDDGSCYVNGTKQYFRTQMSDLPICKVSPVRVSLASYYNKTIVERNVNKAHSFIAYLQKLISKVNLQQPNTILLDYGISKDTDTKLPYEYAEISNIYKSIVITDSTNSSKYNFNFIYKNRFNETNDSITSYLTNIESKLNAVYLGIKQNSNESSYYCFITQNNIIKIIDEKENVQLSTTFIDLLYSIFPAIIQPTSRLTEWTNIKILDKKFPVIFLLAYRFGLEHVLQYLGSQYILIDRPARLSNMHIRSSDIIITFKNKYLIIPRYPIRNSLILAGLDFFDTKDMNFEEFNNTDVYYQLLINKNFKINYLKGIDDTFDHFVDPITREVLIQMNEPTTFKDLLIRATDMVSNNHHLEASSVHNHRYRSYERFAGTLYNEMARQFNSFTKKKSAGATFSLNPNAIFLRIIQDQSMLQMDDINPIHDIKTKASVTYTGIGGRSGESFVVNDRRYPRDGMGVLSPDTADSGNVAINAGTPMDPTVTNLYGLFKQVDPKELKPTNLLSAAGLVMPGSTQDDFKRYGFIGIQLSHQMATKEGSTLRYRTGYESLIAHRAGKLFSYPAKQDGTVIAINETARMVKIQYKDGSIHTFTYGEEYGYCSDLVTTQKQELTVKLGDTFKKGEILCYNPQFFEKDPYTRQVYWKHGVIANVAIIEIAGDFEDSSTITKKFGEKLQIEPVQIRLINIDKNTYVHMFKHIGEKVDINDDLMIFEDANATDLSGIAKDNETLEYLAKLNRNTPRAKFAGTIVGIEMYIGCELSELHETLKEIYKEANKVKKARYRFASDSEESIYNPTLKIIPKGTKFKGVTFDENTVVIRYMIKEELNAGVGDKSIIDSALKSIISDVLSDPVKTESGIDIDILFSASSTSNRMIFSVFLQGMCERILEKLEDDVVDIWDRM